MKDKDGSENGQNSTMFSSKPPKYQENGTETEESWSKSLENLPIFTRKHIDLHRDKCGKKKLKGGGTVPVNKTLKRGAKFQEERYLCSDHIFTQVRDGKFLIKSKCRASMSKREIHNQEVKLDLHNGNVLQSSCSCKAGKSGYCNHAMALLLEIAEYSLYELKETPEEKACTSKARRWGVPSEKNFPKESVIKTSIHKTGSSRGIQSTLYDPRIKNAGPAEEVKVNRLSKKLLEINPGMGFAHIIQPFKTLETVVTCYGNQILGSPLSYQLSVVDHNFEVMTNLEAGGSKSTTDYGNAEMPDSIRLPKNLLRTEESIKNWKTDKNQKEFLSSLEISLAEAHDIEMATVSQSECDEWHERRKKILTASIAHSIFNRKRNFETLSRKLIEGKKITATVTKMLQHGKRFETVAREKYFDILKLNLSRNVKIRETGLVINPAAFWLGASPDGLIVDANAESNYGLIEIKCPESKKNCTPTEALLDSNFYVHLVDGKPTLKKEHSLGYYSQVQFQLGICQLPWCDFVVYFFQGIIIIRIPFDDYYFQQLFNKMTNFYRHHFLQELVSRNKVQTIDNNKAEKS